ncbi:MAG TPA: hypothetical protein VH280_19110 [Verrucomicrobiae bacterium]|jgi:hypothetical protein|nr:hypothetical protein [Verrucomicrobiae bacterium]
MKIRSPVVALAWFTFYLIFNSQFSSTSAQGTAFLYQGHLDVNGAPANGIYDVQFTLYSTNVAGNAVAGPVTNSAAFVSNGLFTIAVDFGPGVFAGASYWLDVAVRTNGGGVFNELVPRQQIASVPYATFANGTSNLLGLLPSTQLSGMLPLAQMPPALVTNGGSGVTLSGTFNGTVNALDGNMVTTNMAKTAFKVISPTPPADGDTNWFGPWTPGTQTAGIQEALNSLMPVNDDPVNFYGGEIFIRPGLYLLTQTVQTPTNSINGTPKANVFLTLVGAGEKASVLCYSNATAGTVLVLGDGRTGVFNAFNALNFMVKNIGFTSFKNGQTNLVFVNGNNGGVFRGSIEDCWFASWYSLTNDDAQYGQPADLVPINLQCNFGGDTFTIAGCQFYNVNSIYWATDHGQAMDNFFAFSGYGATWPNTSPFSLRAAIVCGEPGSGLANGNESWTFERNYFELCNGYVSLGGGNPAASGYAVSRDDAWESGGTLCGLMSAANSSRIFLFENPRTFTGTWTNCTISVSPFSIIGPTPNAHLADMRTGNLNFPVNAPAFVGSGSGLTFTNAAGAAFRLVVNATTNGFDFIPQ